MITVAYTGRPELDSWAKAALGDVILVEAGQPCDLGVSIGGSHIFTAAEIARARCGIVNLHFAPLPQYRGRYSAGHALRLGDSRFGVTLHYIDEGIDTGPIIARRMFDIEPDETVESLRARAFAAGSALFNDLAPLIVEEAHKGRRLPSRPQDESLARYFDRASIELLR